MKLKSLPARIALLVSMTFALVLVIASFFLLRWFEGRLLAEVRSDDSEELNRQVQILANMEQLLDGEEAPVDQLIEGGLVAIIPDDGTFVTITTEDGILLGDSALSMAELTDSITGPQLPVYEGMSEEEVLVGLLDLSDFYERLQAEMPPQTLAEFSESVKLIEAEIEDSIDLPTSLEEIDDERSAEYASVLTNLIFGAGSRSATPEGRLVVSERQTTAFGQKLTIRAESRVAGIDHSLSAMRTVLWFSVPALTLLVAAMAYLAAQRALRPVAQMTSQVDRIRSAESSDRVPVSDTSDEISNLAMTMNQMLDRLEKSSLSQRRFVSDLSHELRTPAAVIRAEIEAALAEPDNDWSETASSVLAEQTRLTNLVDDLILLARLDEAHPTDPRSASTSLSEVDLDDLVRQEAKRGWEHTIDTSQVEPVRLNADARQIGRLVQNLLANADRHTRSEIVIGLSLQEGLAVLTVDDDGSGVPIEDRGAVFDRFTRLDEGRARDSGGSGLGLAIVREVAEANGGSALVLDSPLGGARFRITLLADPSN